MDDKLMTDDYQEKKEEGARRAPTSREEAQTTAQVTKVVTWVLRQHLEMVTSSHPD